MIFDWVFGGMTKVQGEVLAKENTHLGMAVWIAPLIILKLGLVMFLSMLLWPIALVYFNIWERGEK